MIVRGREVVVGDAITFAPGNKPIRVVRFDKETYMHPTLEMRYRIFYDFADRGFTLFDEHPHWKVAGGEQDA